jgi:hypothetical protein
MSVCIQTYDHILIAPDGIEYRARACGVLNGEIYEGWIEFVPLEGGEVLRTPRETTQPNAADLEYWASGISAVYLEGALLRVPKYAREHHPSRPGMPLIFDDQEKS